MKRRIFILLAILAVFIFNAIPAHALTDPPDDTPTIQSMKFYRNLIETDDRLLLIYADIPYATTPDDPVNETYLWELLDTDGITVLGSTVGYAYVTSGYNRNVYSMYFSAADALTWDPTPNYTLRLQGNPIMFASPPEYNFTVTSADYSSFSDTDDEQAELTADIKTIAVDLDLEWGLGTSLIYDDESGQTLSTLGQAFFRGAIYSIQSMAPDLFPLVISDISLADRTWSSNYTDLLANQYAGTWVDTAKAAGAALFSTDYDLLSLIIIFAMFIGVIVANVYLTNDHWNGFVDGAIILIFGAKIGAYSLGYLALIVAICVIYLGIRLKSVWQGG